VTDLLKERKREGERIEFNYLKVILHKSLQWKRGEEEEEKNQNDE